MILLAGALLFALREARRSLYAILELGVASAMAWDALGGFSAESALSGSMKMASALQLVVRGLDNLKTGINSVAEVKPKDQATK